MDVMHVSVEESQVNVHFLKEWRETYTFNADTQIHYVSDIVMYYC
jgi:hypothetical protein